MGVSQLPNKVATSACAASTKAARSSPSVPCAVPCAVRCFFGGVRASMQCAVRVGWQFSVQRFLVGATRWFAFNAMDVHLICRDICHQLLSLFSANRTTTMLREAVATVVLFDIDTYYIDVDFSKEPGL